MGSTDMKVAVGLYAEPSGWLVNNPEPLNADNELALAA